MSVQEPQQQINKLSPEERREIAAFLKAQRLIESSEFKAKIERAHREMDEGHFVTLDELKALLKKSRPRGA